MASAPTKDSGGQLPTGFQSPFFKRVPMQGTHDDLLACAATLCGKTMDDIKKMAVTLGMRANGPSFMDETLFRKILLNCSNLAVSDYKDFTSLSALPDVCVLCCDYSKFDESFRHVVFHHVRGTGKHAAAMFPAVSLPPSCCAIKCSAVHCKCLAFRRLIPSLTIKDNSTPIFGPFS